MSFKVEACGIYQSCVNRTELLFRCSTLTEMKLEGPTRTEGFSNCFCIFFFIYIAVDLETITIFIFISRCFPKTLYAGYVFNW